MFDALLSRGAFTRLALVVAGLATLAPHARAHDLRAKAACGMSFDQVVTIGHGVVVANPEATFTEYGGDEAKKLVAAMNAVEPVSAWTAEHIVVIDPSGGEAFRVGVVDKGCVTHAFPVPREIWPGIVREALGLKS